MALSLDSPEKARWLVLGATLLGTGGGGNPKRGLAMLEEALSQGSIRVVNLEDLEADDLIVVPYFVGSMAPGSAKLEERISDPMRRAVEEMEKELGRRVTAVIANELGGSNTPVAIYVASKLGLKVVDGDLLGRAAPELHQCTANVAGVPMSPAVAVTATGNVVVIRSFSSLDDYEAIVRHLSVLGGGSAALVDTPMTVSEASRAVVRGTLSLCLRLGRVLESAGSGAEAAEAAARVLDGWVVFHGVVSEYTWRDEGGFLVGELAVKGVEEFSGMELKSWIKNEHIMVWINGKPAVMPPDIFTLITAGGKPVTNAELEVGMEVYGIAARAPSIWRTPKGLELFGPRRFGFSYDYVPVEELLPGVLGLKNKYA